MKAFVCTCGQPLYFDNLRCLACGANVAYDPQTTTLTAVVCDGDDLWSIDGDTRFPAPRFRLCTHRPAAAACNWLVPAEMPDAICLSCRTTHQIPPLDRPRNADRLREIESAKRRMLHELLLLGLPVVPKQDDAVSGVAFDLLESLEGEPRILTGHAGGLITINVAEADDNYREFHREALREPYRTVLGHLRHEIGHYYWDRLIANTDWLPRFRGLFGDERADYGEALRRQYADGPSPDWPDRHISAYASAHPWEDWAETWAHYLHARATLGTVESFGLSVRATPIRITPFDTDVLYRDDNLESGRHFLAWLNAWVMLTAVLNETARSMGQPDIYPFVLTRPVVTKLHFIQCVVEDNAAGAVVQSPQFV
ncbi:MAG: putative zinc-binding metallopeptidase [Casimicrobiaceae bacterium]